MSHCQYGLLTTNMVSKNHLKMNHLQNYRLIHQTYSYELSFTSNYIDEFESSVKKQCNTFSLILLYKY